jgi:hypothetical protein
MLAAEISLSTVTHVRKIDDLNGKMTTTDAHIRADLIVVI